MGTRVAQFGQALLGTKYVAWTLEIDDRVESPSANFNGLDYWTFFEIALGLARMIAKHQRGYSPSDLLRQIEWTRYRGGVCQRPLPGSHPLSGRMVHRQRSARQHPNRDA